MRLLAGRAAHSVPCAAAATVTAAVSAASTSASTSAASVSGRCRLHGNGRRPTLTAHSHAEYGMQRRAASSSSSSSSPSATMLKFQAANASQSKGKSAAGSDPGEDGSAQASEADPQEQPKRRGPRSKAAPASEHAAREAPGTESSPSDDSATLRPLPAGSASDPVDSPALATSPGPPPPNRSDTVAGPSAKDAASWAEIANPRTLVAHLDSYVIGQRYAKKALSVAVFNHYVRLQSNVQARVEQEERAVAQQWAAERDKERDLSRRLQNAVDEAERARITSTRFGSPTLSDRTTQETSGPASKSAARGGVERAKSPRRLKPTEETAEAGPPSRGAENILSDFIGQREGTTPGRSERDFGYFSSNEARLTTRPSKRKDPRIGAVSSGLDGDERMPQNQDERVRRAIRVANARLDGKKLEAEVVSEAPESISTQPAQPAEPVLSSPDDDRRFQRQAYASSSPTPTSAPTRALPPFEKANVLLLGPTGSGKTLLLRTLASALHVPFVHIDATPLTQAGYVGEDVDSIVQRLLVASGYDSERAGYGIVCIDEVDKLAARRGIDGTGGGRDVGGEGVQQALLRLLEGSVVTITDKGGQGAAAAAAGSGASAVASMAGSAGAGPQAPRSSLAVEPDQVPPWWPGVGRSVTMQGPRPGGADDAKSWSTSTPTGRKATSAGLPGFTAAGRSSALAQSQNGVYHVDTSSVLFVLCGAFVGLEKIVRDRLVREGAWPSHSISRGDDKISHDDRETLLKHVEDVDLQAFGLIPEFVGRVPVIAALSPLTEKDLVRVLTEPKNSLISQYESLFSSSGVALRVTKPALRAIAAQAARKSTGARGLRRIMEDRLLDAMYLAPGSSIMYGLVDEQAAWGAKEVQLYSRGGKTAWLAAAADDDARDEGTGVGSRAAAGANPVSTPRGPGQSKSDALEVHTTLRRKSRTRLVRPSRLGHFRIRL